MGHKDPRVLAGHVRWRGERKCSLLGAEGGWRVVGKDAEHSCQREWSPDGWLGEDIWMPSWGLSICTVLALGGG